LSIRFDNIMEKFKPLATIVSYSDEECGIDKEDFVFDNDGIEDEFKEQYNECADKMSRLNRRERQVIRKARAKFKIKVEEVEYLRPIERNIDDIQFHVQFDDFKIPLFRIDPIDFLNMRCPMFDNAAVRLIKSADEAKKVAGGAIFVIDTRYPMPFILKVFKEKMENIINENERKLLAYGRKHFAKWAKYLIAYKFSKENIPHREIGRLMGAKIHKSSNNVFFTLEPIDKKTWKDQYHRKNVSEMTQIKNNVEKKINSAKRLISDAGRGRFPGFL
jgi:hypothetical protein